MLQGKNAKTRAPSGHARQDFVFETTAHEHTTILRLCAAIGAFDCAKRFEKSLKIAQVVARAVHVTKRAQNRQKHGTVRTGHNASPLTLELRAIQVAQKMRQRQVFARKTTARSRRSVARARATPPKVGKSTAFFGKSILSAG